MRIYISPFFRKRERGREQCVGSFSIKKLSLSKDRKDRKSKKDSARARQKKDSTAAPAVGCNLYTRGRNIFPSSPAEQNPSLANLSSAKDRSKSHHHHSSTHKKNSLSIISKTVRHRHRSRLFASPPPPPTMTMMMNDDAKMRNNDTSFTSSSSSTRSIFASGRAVGHHAVINAVPPTAPLACGVE